MVYRNKVYSHNITHYLQHLLVCHYTPVTKFYIKAWTACSPPTENGAAKHLDTDELLDKFAISVLSLIRGVGHDTVQIAKTAK